MNMVRSSARDTVPVSRYPRGDTVPSPTRDGRTPAAAWLAHLPPDLAACEWLDADVLEALDAVSGPQANRKRTIIVCLARSLAEGLDAAFDASSDPEPAGARELQSSRTKRSSRTLRSSRTKRSSRTYWYTSWRFERAVQRALDIAVQRAVEAQRQRSANREAIAAIHRRAALADASLRAVEALLAVAADPAARADHRVSAARALIAYADPEMAARDTVPVSRYPRGYTVPSLPREALTRGWAPERDLPARRGLGDIVLVEPCIDLSGYTDDQILALLRSDDGTGATPESSSRAGRAPGSSGA